MFHYVGRPADRYYWLRMFAIGCTLALCVMVAGSWYLGWLFWTTILRLLIQLLWWCLAWFVTMPELPWHVSEYVAPAPITVTLDKAPVYVEYTGSDSFEDTWLREMEAPPPPRKPQQLPREATASRDTMMLMLGTLSRSGAENGLLHVLSDSPIDLVQSGGAVLGGALHDDVWFASRPSAGGVANVERASGSGSNSDHNAVGAVGGSLRGVGTGTIGSLGTLVSIPRVKRLRPAKFDEQALLASGLDVLRCVVRVTVAADGTPSTVKAESSCAGQAAAAEAAARASTYEPATRDGQPFAAPINVRYRWDRPD